MVSEGRELKSGSDPAQRLGMILKSPFERLGPKALVRYLMYLPLNFIPVVGTSWRNRGKLIHGRSASQRSAWLEKHTRPYTAYAKPSQCPSPVARCDLNVVSLHGFQPS
ncbi:Outer spore wall protein RRT8 [Tolypocladium capitatum]|uniref:Outer spore wall protein RRT8 n=1 Tax=Tolypocladium capitatum TaxID=45235 RepID=A0A2K3QG62_9HYPO|nr:Outer spore wall protein RRT8 [Tolypocladium capitatum]